MFPTDQAYGYGAHFQNNTYYYLIQIEGLLKHPPRQCTQKYQVQKAMHLSMLFETMVEFHNQNYLSWFHCFLFCHFRGGCGWELHLNRQRSENYSGRESNKTCNLFKLIRKESTLKQETRTANCRSKMSNTNTTSRIEQESCVNNSKNLSHGQKSNPDATLIAVVKNLNLRSWFLFPASAASRSCLNLK